MNFTNVKVISFVVLLLNAIVPNFSIHRLRSRKDLFKIAHHSAVSSSAYYSTKWFTQKLDHFDHLDSNTWQQRYFMREDNYKPGGPIFLMLSGEGTASGTDLANYQPFFQYGAPLNAIYFNLEHRFYGKSHPTEDKSTSNLRYLSTAQALADAAVFASYLHSTYGSNTTKLIVNGGSYAGNLAAWFRLKYPQLVDLAIAASAPVTAVTDFKGFLDVVTVSISSYSKSCLDSLVRGLQQTEELLRQDPTLVSTTFRVCPPLETKDKLQISNFFSCLIGNIEFAVQYHNDNFIFEGIPNVSVNQICSYMNNSTYGNEMYRLAAINSWFLDEFDSSGTCYDARYESLIEQMEETSWNSTVTNWAADFVFGDRLWFWQTCTEYGYYQTSDSNFQPFGHWFQLPFWTKLCYDVFGFSLDFIKTQVHLTNVEFGAKNLKATRILLPNGSVDPWHFLGITSIQPGSDWKTGIQTLFMNGTGHCADMFPPSQQDLPALTHTRNIIKRAIHDCVLGLGCT